MKRDFGKIEAWRLADDLALMIYQYTQRFPKTETWSLTSQLRRAAISVPANIVEGSSRKHRKEYLQFLYTAYGSLAEVGYYIEFANKVGYLKNGDFEELISKHKETTKTLYGLISYIEKRPYSQ